MGWSGGNDIAQRVIDSLERRDGTGDVDVIGFYSDLINILEDHDADTLEDVGDTLWQIALRKVHPDWDWED
jgi:hypothetical protein